ncbi:hypothetical protein PRUB_a2783 [Pseudoalteromonas rubra]|uniref:Orphan protein n=1 Tax=Pseudoalteromonas rubra TaxID=43658 RepID=A0A8T0CDV1_9GAMM|nr:hypothetical protein [Pseudoalteromonas rubra]KAF7788185.1 hypothetical protein PRUB_a2783 [Pseudoalteromonas rubra]
MKPQISIIALLLAGCSNTNSPELNQCAQQNYQCEQSCEQRANPQSMAMQVCSDGCIESFNQCKAQAEQLTQQQRNSTLY